MAAFTSIAAATVSIGGSVAKGFLAGDAAADAARAAGRMRIQQQELEKQSIARLEANFYDAVRATTDVYDKQLQLANAQGSQILEAAQEGDQRGVSATAGKIKQVQDATSGAVADKFAEQKLDIDMKRAEASEMDGARIAAMFDDRAAAAGVKADALTQQADQLKGQATGAFIDAGVSTLGAAATAFGGLGGMKNKMGKAADSLSKSTGMDRAAALKQIEGLGLDRKGLNSIIDSGALPSVTQATTVTSDNILSDANTPAGIKTANVPGGNAMGFDVNALINSPEYQEFLRKKKEEEQSSVGSFNSAIDGAVGRINNMMTDIFNPE